MKNYKNAENKLWAFELDCFDENGQVINEVVEKIITENNLVEITEEEAKELSKPVITKEQLIEKINQKAYSDITAVYPEWKQLNIIRNKDYNLQAYEEMTVFIDQIRAYADLEVMNLEGK